MPEIATKDNVIEAWGPLSVREEQVIEWLLSEASTKLRLRVPNVDAMVAEAGLLADAAKIAVVNAVKRVLQNPEAVRQISTTTGPVTDSKTIDAAVSSGFVYISEEDLTGLRRKRSRQRIRSFRVRSGYR
ncbi:Gp19/Gp15/Gp42 family protein [Arthrobacter sp. Soc17.1.1.1]|uniref:Gp19/Gp15/Gp42 family protein n=1 Tax=Arthrobacter sp. Soc17.1.1.1 TaxID=3121277 RepID=UPI002FE4323E